VATRRLNPVRLLAPYRRLLAIAFVAMLVTSAADLLEPWPLKVIFDYVLGSKRMPAWLASVVDTSNRIAVLDLAALAVVAIAVFGAISSYTNDYLSATGRQACRVRPAASALSPRAAHVALLLRTPANRRYGRASDERHRRC
jgi:ABC-type multidrug transport system fused ATPase/permease subunit